MPTKKNAPKKSVKEKTIIGKIAGKVGYLAAELTAGKEHLTEMAGEAIDSVKSKLQGVAPKKTIAKKPVVDKVKKVVTKKVAALKKSAKPVAKKVTALKKAAKKTAAKKS